MGGLRTEVARSSVAGCTQPFKGWTEQKMKEGKVCPLPRGPSWDHLLLWGSWLSSPWAAPHLQGVLQVAGLPASRACSGESLQARARVLSALRPWGTLAPPALGAKRASGGVEFQERDF